MASGARLIIEHVHPTLRVDTAALEHLLRRVLTAEGYRPGYLSVVLAGHETVLALNRTYLAHDEETDVLSFNLSDDPSAKVVEGEVYVDLDTAAERHAEFGASFEEEVRRYAVHGLLHLVGYEDATDAQRTAMRALEDAYLSATS